LKEKLAFAALQALRKLQAKSYELEEWLYDRAFPPDPFSKSALIERLPLIGTKDEQEFFLSLCSKFPSPEDIFGPIK
jgi:hypothetical protein